MHATNENSSLHVRQGYYHHYFCRVNWFDVLSRVILPKIGFHCVKYYCAKSTKIFAFPLYNLIFYCSMRICSKANCLPKPKKRRRRMRSQKTQNSLFEAVLFIKRWPVFIHICRLVCELWAILPRSFAKK